MRFVLASMAIVMLIGGPGTAWSTPTPGLILHARSGESTSCTAPQNAGLNCEAGRPTVDLTATGSYGIYVYLRCYEGADAVQAAFDWPVAWSIIDSKWNCQPGSLVVVEPTAPGPTTGTISVAFNRITGGTLVPIGVLVLDVNSDGCFSVIESSYPFGTHIVDNPPTTYPILEANRGRICMNGTGIDACNCLTPVEPSTWGQIKATYGQ